MVRSEVMERDRFLQHCKGRSNGPGDHIQRKDESTFMKGEDKGKFSERSTHL